MSAPKPHVPIPAIALEQAAAAAALSMSSNFFRDNVAPELPVIRVKGKTLYPTAALAAWATANAEPVLNAARTPTRRTP